MQPSKSGWRSGDAHDDAAVPEGLVMIDPRVYGACSCASRLAHAPLMQDDAQRQ
jgi:hypothetical protein